MVARAITPSVPARIQHYVAITRGIDTNKTDANETFFHPAANLFTFCRFRLEVVGQSETTSVDCLGDRAMVARSSADSVGAG